MKISEKIGQASIQAAFIAISSRLVGAVFRFTETLNPDFQETRVISEPKTVLIREVSTLGMAWLFSLGTNIAVKPWLQKRGWRYFGIQFITAVVGTTLAEGLGRLIAYSKTLREKKLADRKGMIPYQGAPRVAARQGLSSSLPAVRQSYPTPLYSTGRVGVSRSFG